MRILLWPLRTADSAADLAFKIIVTERATSRRRSEAVGDTEMALGSRVRNDRYRAMPPLPEDHVPQPTREGVRAGNIRQKMMNRVRRRAFSAQIR
jgi:hypothetical protein